MSVEQTALGGTFDHFHAGHRHFLKTAAAVGNPLCIGVTTPALITHKKYQQSMQTYAERAAAVTDFCRSEGITHTIVELTDVCGPVCSDPTITHLAYTSDTQRGAQTVAEKRSGNGLAPVTLLEVSLLPDAAGGYIASEAIRAGRLSRTGTVYADALKSTIILPPHVREKLRTPLGPLIQHPSSTSGIKILIGDSTVARFHEEKWQYDIAFIDYMTQRAPLFPRVVDRTECSRVCINPPHTITSDLYQAVQSALTIGTRYTLVIGEEDLAAVAVVLLAPLTTTMYYGQPRAGLVECRITESVKDELYTLLCP